MDGIPWIDPASVSSAEQDSVAVMKTKHGYTLQSALKDGILALKPDIPDQGNFSIPKKTEITPDEGGATRMTRCST